MAGQADELAHAAAREAEIQRLEQQIAPLQARLTELRRQVAARSAGQASARGRRDAAADRDRQIVKAANQVLKKAWVPIDWQRSIAEEFGLSTRQVRRILRAADVNADHRHSRPQS